MTPLDAFDHLLNELNTKTNSDVSAPLRIQSMLVACIAVADGFKINCGQLNSVTEDEWLEMCRRTYRRIRTKPGAGN